MKIGVAWVGPTDRVWIQVEVPDGCTVADGIARSGILERCPDIDIDKAKVGVFGKVVKKDAALRPGDRVEIYRPIICDPETVPRRNGADDDDDE